jgi:hypothetical protein
MAIWDLPEGPMEIKHYGGEWGGVLNGVESTS